MNLTVADIQRITRGRATIDGDTSAVTGVTTDSRRVQPGNLFVALRGDTHDGHDHVTAALAEGATAAVVERPVPAVDGRTVIVVDDAITALQQIAAVHRDGLRARVVAITGSNGKTTVKDMVGHVLAGAGPCVTAERSFNNHLGVPLTLLRARAEHDFVVLEIGSNAPGEIAALARIGRPHVAVVTSIGSAHLAGLGDSAGILREKLALLDHLEPDGRAIVNIDHPDTAAALATKARTVTTTGLSTAADIHPESLALRTDGVHITLAGMAPVSVPLLGRHNGVNALSAWAAARCCGLDDAFIAARLRTVVPPPMRLEPLRHGRMAILNDCYNANPTSLAAAIDTLENLEVPGRRVAIIGDMLELGDRAAALHARAGRRIAEGAVDVLIGIGELTAGLCAAARNVGRPTLEVHTCGTLADIVPDLERILRGDDTVLVKGSRGGRLERLLEPLQDFGCRHGEAPHRAVRTL